MDDALQNSSCCLLVLLIQIYKCTCDIITLLPAHLSKNSRSSFRAASLNMFKFTLPYDRWAAIFPHQWHQIRWLQMLVVDHVTKDGKHNKIVHSVIHTLKNYHTINCHCRVNVSHQCVWTLSHRSKIYITTNNRNTNYLTSSAAYFLLESSWWYARIIYCKNDFYLFCFKKQISIELQFIL